MRRPSHQVQNHKIKHGTTLLEVLLGLALLATLLSAVVIARGRFLRQWADADRKLKMTEAADKLMEQLSIAAAETLQSASGDVANLPNVRWRTQLIDDPAAAAIGANKARLDLFDSRNPSTAIAVEFLVHKVHPTTSPSNVAARNL